MLCVRDIMTPKVVRLSPESTIREAMEVLSTNHLSGAPVVAGERVVGLISMSDILGFLIAAPKPGRSSEPEEAVSETWEELQPAIDEDEELQAAALSEDVWEEWTENTEARIDDIEPFGDSLLDQHTVEEAMSRELFATTPGSSIKAAATSMRKRGIHRLLVMEGKTLVGIISSLDIARAVSEKGLAGATGIKPEVAPPAQSPWITS